MKDDRQKKINVVLETAEKGGYVIYSKAFPGCVSEGESIGEALRNFAQAVELWLEPVEPKPEKVKQPQMVRRG